MLRSIIIIGNPLTEMTSGLDELIKPIVDGLNVAGHRTIDSCQGRSTGHLIPTLKKKGKQFYKTHQYAFPHISVFLPETSREEELLAIAKTLGQKMGFQDPVIMTRRADVIDLDWVPSGKKQSIDGTKWKITRS